MKLSLQLLLVSITWRLAVQTIMEIEVPNCENLTKTCGARGMGEHRANPQLCSCDKECDLFGECCGDWGLENLTKKLKGLQDEQVYGIPRKYWGCQRIKTDVNKMVRMVTKCPAGTATALSARCEASSAIHYTMFLPRLSATGVWYQNVYCALCHGDEENLLKLNNSMNCSNTSSKEEILQIINKGTFTEEQTWVLAVNKTMNRTCSVQTEVPENTTQLLRSCGLKLFSKVIVPIESCPADWHDQDFAQKCQAYTMYVKKSNNDSGYDSVLTQVFRNPHCAVCNGLPASNITCVLPLPGIDHRSRFKPVALNIIVDFMDMQQESEIMRDCEMPKGLWDPLHNECIELSITEVQEEQNGQKNSSYYKTHNFTCPTISLKRNEYQRLENGSIKFMGKDSYYTEHIFNKVEFLEDGTAVICAPDPEGRDFISGTPQEYLTVFCLSISVICLILHVATYCALPKLCNLPGKNLLALSWALMFAQLILLVGVRPEFEVPEILCVGIAALEHFCFLAAFFWMNVMSVDIWRTFSQPKIRGAGGMKTHRKYAGYAWGSSASICLVAIIVDLATDTSAVKPSFGKNQLCWFGNGGGLGLFFALPMFLLLMVNLSLFISTVRKIWLTRRQGVSYIRDKTKAELLQSSLRNSSDTKSSSKPHHTSASISGRKEQARFYLYMKLFTIMGLTWMFGFIATFTRISFLWYPFIIFNGLQGAFIFVMFDVKRNIAFMLWEKFFSKHGYTPPGFIARSSSSSTKTTSSSRVKSTTVSGRSSSGQEATRTLSSSSHSVLSSTESLSPVMEIGTFGPWWALAVLALMWLVYTGITWNHGYWKKRGVPYVRPLPLFGNVKDSILVRRSIGEVLQDLYWKFDKYSYAGIFSPTKPSLLIRDPDLIKNMLVRDFTSFHDNDLHVDIEADPMAGRNPFLLKGECWKVTRARVAPAFSPAKLKTVFPLITEVCHELQETIRNDQSAGEFEAKELCARFTTDVVTTCAFGVQGNSLKNPDSEFRQVGREMMNTGITNTIKFMTVFFMPALSSFISMRFIPKKVEDFFVSMVRQVMTYRKENQVTRNDYIQQLIDMKNSIPSTDKYPFQDIDIAAQASTFFIDGFETSSTAFSFALYALAINPHVQTKLREEVNAILKEEGGELSYDAIQRMAYMDMFLSESLRMYTPLCFLTRECTEPIRLETPSGGEYVVEKGTSVHIPICALHHDPQYYPDPETFDPERFTEENKKNRPKFAYLPFGEGPRICLGMRFAITQVKAGIAAVVSSFVISKTSRTPVPIVPEAGSLIFAAKGGLWLKFSPVNLEETIRISGSL